MNTNYSLKNFRVFGGAGASFKMTPITILTGCNSSGKSSVVKSMILLKDFFEKSQQDKIANNRYNPRQYFLDFSTAGINLCNFDSVLNRNGGAKEFVLSYTITPIILEYRVELYFEAKDDDFFNNGWLSKMLLYDCNGKVVLSAKAKAKRDYLFLQSLDLNTAFIEEFMPVAYATTLKYIIDERSKSLSIYGDCVEDQESYDIWDNKFNQLISILEKKGDRPLVNYIYNKIQQYGDNTIEELSSQDLSIPVQHMEESMLLFYFPVFEKFKDKPKSECINLIKKAETVDFLDQDESMKVLALEIAEDYEKSSFDDFVDYCRSLENEELSNVVATVSELGHNLKNYEQDFIDAVKTVADIRYEPGNDIHTLGMYPHDTVNFNKIYKFLSRWQWAEGLSPEIFKHYASSDLICSSHVIYDALLTYLKFMLDKVLNPDIFSRLRYVGNFQSDIRRIYVFDGNENKLGNTIKEFLYYKAQLLSLNKENEWFRKREKKPQYVPGTFVNNWLKKLKIGKSLNIIEDNDGLGAKVFLRKDANRRGYPLADEGYGISQLVTFLLHIEVEILIDKVANERSRFKSRNEPAEKRIIPTLSLEEPEVSLHPSLQSKLADIFLDAYKNYGIHFIIETHSEYLIRRTQAFVANYKSQEEFQNNPFSVIYVGQNGNAYDLEYLETGRFNRSFGPGFFDEATRSCVEILKRERRDRNGKKA